MIDIVIHHLSEEFRREGLLVPFGTTYRIAEKLIEEQNNCSKELMLCNECKHYVWDEFDGCHVCIRMSKYVKKDFFCAFGERKTE